MVVKMKQTTDIQNEDDAMFEWIVYIVNMVNETFRYGEFSRDSI